MNIPQILADYDEFHPKYDRVVELKQEAETYPDMYAEADELEADLNEHARDLLESAVDTIRRRDPAELERQMMTAVRNLIGDAYIDEYVRDKAREFVERAAWWADGGDAE